MINWLRKHHFLHDFIYGERYEIWTAENLFSFYKFRVYKGECKICNKIKFKKIRENEKIAHESEHEKLLRLWGKNNENI